MATYKSIPCPQKKDHKYEKILAFVGKEELYFHCKDHFWIKVIFKKGSEKVNFEDTAVVLKPMGENFHFDHEAMK